jgi:antitoxin component YwqK of YwqJK toxin-antitoxin module
MTDKENYKDGQREGLWDYFSEIGQLERRGNWKNWERDGLWEYFDEDGNLTKTETYEDGHLIECPTGTTRRI